MEDTPSPIEFAVGRLWITYMGQKDKRHEFALRLFEVLDGFEIPDEGAADQALNGMGIGAWTEVALAAQRLVSAPIGSVTERRQRWAQVVLKQWEPEFVALLLEGIPTIEALRIHAARKQEGNAP